MANSGQVTCEVQNNYLAFGVPEGTLNTNGKPIYGNGSSKDQGPKCKKTPYYLRNNNKR